MSEPPEKNTITPLNRGLKIVGFLERYSIVSFKNALLHAILAVILFALLNRFLPCRVEPSQFTIVMSSISVVSGALLAISAAVAVFFGEYFAEWRDRLLDRLKQSRTDLEAQMEKSAPICPDIPQRLTDLYLLAAFYVPGQSLDADSIFKASKVYDDWAKEQAIISQEAGKKFRLGDLKTYNSFEKHLFDTTLRVNELRSSLVLLSVAERISRIGEVFPPLLTFCLGTFLFSLASTVLASVRLLPESTQLSMIFTFVYLVLVASFELAVASRNIIWFVTRGLESGYDIAMRELVGSRSVDGKDSVSERNPPVS